MKASEIRQEDYAAQLADLTDDALVKAAENMVWLSAFASNNPRASSHWKVDMVSDEADRRGKPWLYQQGWNQAYRIGGYEPSDDDLARAAPPADQAVEEGK